MRHKTLSRAAEIDNAECGSGGIALLCGLGIKIRRYRCGNCRGKCAVIVGADIRCRRCSLGCGRCIDRCVLLSVRYRLEEQTEEQ
mgnify:CR=1 FL=1